MKWVLVTTLAVLVPCYTAAPVKANQATSHSSTKSGANRSSTKHFRKTRGHPAPSYQQHPDADRYQEIQKALADRGYFKGQVNGEWGDDSVDAVKRFQADQKLPDDGKINAPTLVGLGLGPKHDGAVTPPASPTKPASSAASGNGAPVDSTPKSTPDTSVSRPPGDNRP